MYKCSISITLCEGVIFACRSIEIHRIHKRGSFMRFNIDVSVFLGLWLVISYMYDFHDEIYSQLLAPTVFNAAIKCLLVDSTHTGNH